jgi:hypothetical protein
MEPKLKAVQIIIKMQFQKEPLSFAQGKKCALIAVDLRLDGDFIFTSFKYGEDSLEYWQEVKQEIEKL